MPTTPGGSDSVPSPKRRHLIQRRHKGQRPPIGTNSTFDVSCGWQPGSLVPARLRVQTCVSPLWHAPYRCRHERWYTFPTSHLASTRARCRGVHAERPHPKCRAQCACRHHKLPVHGCWRPTWSSHAYLLPPDSRRARNRLPCVRAPTTMPGRFAPLATRLKSLTLLWDTHYRDGSGSSTWSSLIVSLM
jgi:hypothetical protein